MISKYKYHFITGLPRSGSTLLSAILLQNPKFHAGISSPIAPLISGIITQTSAGSELGLLTNKEQRRRIIQGVFESYYGDQDEKKTIFDTNRIWSAQMPLIKDLFPSAKIIACVRNVAWIMDSIERLYRLNPYEATRLFNNEMERSTVYSRVEALALPNRLVGLPWTALKEAFFGEYANSILIVDYEILAQAPKQAMKLIYEFIEEPEFEHDFSNLQFDTPEFDQALGLNDLHKVKNKVHLKPRTTILPPDLFDQYKKLSFWQNQAQSRANVVTVKKPSNP